MSRIFTPCSRPTALSQVGPGTRRDLLFLHSSSIVCVAVNIFLKEKQGNKNLTSMSGPLDAS